LALHLSSPYQNGRPDHFKKNFPSFLFLKKPNVSENPDQLEVGKRKIYILKKSMARNLTKIARAMVAMATFVGRKGFLVAARTQLPESRKNFVLLRV